LNRSIIRFGIALGFLVALLSPAPAQDKAPPDKPDKPDKPDAKKADTEEKYPEYFRKPETVPDFWEAIQFELEVGKPNIAARLLHEMMKKATDDKELVALEQKVGTASFLRLQTTFLRYQSLERVGTDPKLIEQALQDAKELSARVNKALETVLGDRAAILKHIKNLNGDREERSFAAGQIYNSQALAIPTLVAELQSAKDEDRAAIKTLLPRLHAETVPPLIAALDIDDTNLRLDLIDVLRQRNAREAVPFLWYYADSPKIPERVRNAAKDTIAYLTETQRARLTPAPIALAREAERYYRHQVPLGTAGDVLIWRWDDKAKQLVKGLPGTARVTPSQAEEYYGLKFARQALDIDPTYAPAQQVLLSLVLEKAAERAGGAGQPLPPDVRELLATINSDLLNQILEQGLTDNRLPVVLGAVRALGDLAETRALKPTGHGDPALVRAVNYPDRRVQMAAADALLRIPATPSPNAAGRVVDVLRRAVVSDAPKPKTATVLIGFANDSTADEVAKALQKVKLADGTGFEVIKVRSGREALERLKKSADVDALLIDTQLPDPGLALLLAQLRQDPGFAGLPLWLVTPWDTQESLKQRQGQIEEDLFAFRRRKQMLVEERRRAEANYLNAKGNAAAPLKARLDQLDVELKGFTQEQEDVILAARKALERQLLTAPPAREAALRRLVEHYRHTWLLPESAAHDATFLKRALALPLADAAGQPLTEPERKAYAERSLSWLDRIARGEVAGYDFTPAEDALYRALHATTLSDEARKAAIDATARLPAARGGDKPQTELAAVLLDRNRSLPVREAAAAALLRRIQQHTPALTRPEVETLETLQTASGTDPKLREAVALVIGATRPGARLTGERLKGFEPKPPAPPPPPKEEKPPVPPKEDKP
jgi:CheY-like chemotaxis protein